MSFSMSMGTRERKYYGYIIMADIWSGQLDPCPLSPDYYFLSFIIEGERVGTSGVPPPRQ